ncbi:MAG TPA: ATPase, T2SS/T4P/T4SS family [Gemmatimonadales bacterium]|nr:ATPase, T2SS/T4P/T4SS family [Gemmatimonadales bacterium]
MSLLAREAAASAPLAVADDAGVTPGDRVILPGKMQFYTATTQFRILKMLRSAMGPSVTAFLEDPAVTEVSANSDGHVWVDRVGQGRRNTGERLSPTAIHRILSIVADAKGEPIGETNPSFDAIVPGHGYRFIGTLPPLTPAPSMTIRKKPARVISLAEYEDAGILTSSHRAFLEQAAHERLNLILAGGTGSGKTTLANAVLQVMARTGHRIITIEDTPELQNAAPDQESLYALPGLRTMQDCLRCALRMHPDRLIFGEVRGPEVRDMLMAWNTGHRGGLCTIHADSAKDTLARIEEMLGTAHQGPSPQAQIARAINVIVFIETTRDRDRYPAGRFVADVVRVDGIDSDKRYQLTRVD